MDSIEACNIEFLDFSGVNDQEKKRVLSSLHTINSSVQFPWDDEGNNNNYNNNNKFKNRSDGNCHTEAIISLNKQQYIHQNNSPVYISFPTPSATNPIVLYPTAILTTVPCLFNNNYNNAYVDANNYIANCVNNNLEQVPPAPLLPPQQQTSQQQQQQLTDATTTDNNVEIREELNDKTTTPINVPQQNGLITITEETREPSRKSWASLFNKPATLTNNNDLTSPPIMNGTLQKPLVFNNNNNNNTKSVNNRNEKNLCPIKYPKKVTCPDPNSYRIGEFLLGYNLESHTTSLQPRGLINRSNYCYINSILQALLACPPFYNLLSGLANSYKLNDKKMKSTPFIDSMCRFVKEFQHLPALLRVNRRNNNNNNNNNEKNLIINCDPPFEPSWIYKMLNGMRTDSFLVEGRQEDAEEFLGCILNGLNDEILDLMKLVKNDLMTNKIDNNLQNQEADKEWQVMGPKNKGSITRRTEFGQTPISDIFFGLIKSRIHRSGDHYTDNIQPFFTLQLNIEKVQTVRDALESLVSKNQIEGMTSQQTNEEVEAWQQVTLEELPVVLVLHLKCFDFKLDGCTKIMKALEFPIDLKINSKWMSSKINNQKEKMYKLFAIVYHDGKEATKGHYLTDAFHVGYGSWLRYDDSSVKAIQEEQVLKPQGTRVPYLLFYRRRNY